MQYTYKTKGTCAQSIHLDIEDNIVRNIRFDGGCNGNLKAIARLVDGWTVDEIEAKLLGNRCGLKATSCADQLARAVRAAQKEAAGA